MPWREPGHVDPEGVYFSYYGETLVACIGLAPAAAAKSHCFWTAAGHMVCVGLLSTPFAADFGPVHMFVQAFDTLKIPELSFGTRDTLRKVICLSVSRAFFLLLS